MNICILSYMYPGKHNASDFAFVKQLVDELAAQGNNCYVLAPFNILHYKKLSESEEQYSVGRGSVTVYRPGYFSFSNFHIGRFSFSSWSHQKAVNKAFRRLKIKPDVIYGHFWSSAFEGFDYAKAHDIPLFVASGESEIKFRRTERTAAFCDYVSGVICVSSKNRDESVILGLTSCEKCEVFPNAINASLFKKLDKQACRAKLNLPNDAFIVAFVGWFNDRKGSKRVSEALKRIDGSPVCSIFVGKGTEEPDCDSILFKGALPHDEVPTYLNAADVFVLPTLHEGCCNAIVEAMACGLPVISSNLPFNWDVLNERNSIMIDPNNIEEIKNAIVLLRDDETKRKTMAGEALRMVQELSIDVRAQRILEFIELKYNINL